MHLIEETNYSPEGEFDPETLSPSFGNSVQAGETDMATDKGSEQTGVAGGHADSCKPVGWAPTSVCQEVSWQR